MTSQLQVTHQKNLNKVSVMQRSCSRIEATIKGDRPGVQVLAKSINVGVLGDETPPLEVIQNVGHFNSFHFGSK